MVVIRRTLVPSISNDILMLSDTFAMCVARESYEMVAK